MDTPLFLIAIVVPATLIHGIVSSLILRRLYASPQPLTISWVLRSALMGGVFSGRLLKRIVPSMNRSYSVLVAIGWCLCIAFSLLSPDHLFFDPFQTGLVDAGGLAGVGTSLALLLVMALD